MSETNVRPDYLAYGNMEQNISSVEKIKAAIPEHFSDPRRSMQEAVQLAQLIDLSEPDIRSYLLVNGVDLDKSPNAAEAFMKFYSGEGHKV